MTDADLAEHIRAVVDDAPPLPELVVELLTATPRPVEVVADGLAA